ncbi:GNAT family N-acetyltransferase [Actinopolyspora mortivallis]|uniref:GNAT family N-acetyltransferase n=1 Tax=Actinopolyspora mortivallis TaxID=33906 RepID=UPI001FE1811F|nr:GNAT family N-acetyltransferase [Actinopolyspora mortivallis]
MTSIAEIHPMTSGHVPEVLEIGNRVFDISEFPYSTWSLSAIARHLDQQPEACHVALFEGAPVGFVLASMPFLNNQTWGHIEWIGILPAFQGRTLATKLGDASIRALYNAGATRIVADIATSNRQSKLLARSLGFTELTTVSLFSAPTLEWIKTPERTTETVASEA